MRYKFTPLLFVEYGINIYDITRSSWQNFDFPNGYLLHPVTKEETQRPYLIAHAYYQTPKYEEIILLVNNIEDPFELKTNQILKIPRLLDLGNFAREQFINK